MLLNLLKKNLKMVGIDASFRCLPVPEKLMFSANLQKRFFLTEIKKVLILVHRKELLKQAYESLGERCFKN